MDDPVERPAGPDERDWHAELIERGPHFYAWVPGPWLAATSEGPVLDYAVADGRDGFDRLVCEICGMELIVDKRGGPAAWESLRSLCRAHWEGHVTCNGDGVRFFELPNMGQFKMSRVGPWAEVITNPPMIFYPGDPAPPLAVVRAVLGLGEHLGPWGNGREWPRCSLPDDVCQAVRAQVLELAELVDTSAPGWVVDLTGYKKWLLVLKYGCGTQAASDYFDHKDRLIGLLENRETPSREQVFEELRDLMRDPGGWLARHQSA